MNYNALMNYGTFYGVLLIISSLVIYLLGFDSSDTVVSIISLLVSIAGLFYFMNRYKTEVANGFLSFSQAFRSGLMITLFGGILSSFYNWIFMSFIDPSVIEKAKVAAYERAISSGKTEEMAIKEIEMAEPFMTPIAMTLIGLVYFIVMGVIISLVISAIIKKDNPNPFQEA